MKNEIVKYVTPNVVAPFGPPAGWGMAQICLKNAANFCGALIRNRQTGMYMLLNGRTVASIDQKFAQCVWKQHAQEKKG